MHAAGETKVLGRRSAAALIDVLILGALFVGLAGTIGETESQDGQVSVELNGAPALLWFAIAFLYYFVSAHFAGRTAGKALLGLHVVRAGDGERAGGRAIALRTLLRIVDGLPVLYLVGFVTALATGDRRQRIGDLAGGTQVVRASS
jgi:uncharacterized RDD family membrane protein YckC